MSQGSEQFSLQILLPDSVERRFQRWAQRTPGASWPQWGGHISLLPSFVAPGGRAVIEARVTEICAKYQPFWINMSQIVATQDLTRPQYQAVFLTFGSPPDTARSGESARNGTGPGDVEADGSAEPADNGQEMLMRLQRDLDAALRPLREDTRPELSRRAFWPHITLALGLADAEANKMIQSLRAEGLTAQFEVNGVWLISFRKPDGGDVQTERVRIGLGTALETTAR